MADLRKKGIRASVAEHGVIDLASIVVGVIIIGIISTGIVASVFALIPFTQDKAAEQALGAVSTAESVQYSFSSADGAGVYVGLDELVGLGNAAGESLLQDSESIVIEVTGNAYTAYSVSPTGKIYSVDNTGATADDVVEADLPTGVTVLDGEFVDAR
tara:strand:- start:13343 stop:13816 length:474 start_codon:yes stop_codon:yes gene_type:complete